MFVYLYLLQHENKVIETYYIINISHVNG